MTDTARLRKAALWYAARGLAVLPLEPAGKRPLTAHGVKDASTNPEAVSTWWGRWPDANVGLAVPAWAAVLDVDGPDGWAALRGADLDLPSTLTATTGRGEAHRHLWYRLPEGATGRNAVSILPHVDTRAAGGYVVAPPSHTVGRYRWQGTGAPDFEDVTEAPGWLVEAVAAPRPGNGAPVATSPDEWAELVAGPVPAGARNAALARLAGLLFRCLPAVVAADLAELWAAARMRPPLDPVEVHRTVASIASRELGRRGGGR